MGTGILEAMLLRIAGPPSSQLHVLADLLGPMAEPLDGILAALALAAQALTAYLALALGLRALAYLPGLAGQLAGRAEQALTIPVVRGALDALLGGALIAQLALAPAGTGIGGTFQAPPPAIATTLVPLGHRAPFDHPPPTAATATTIPRPSGTKAPPSHIPLPIWLGADPMPSESPLPPRPRRPAEGSDSFDSMRSPSLPPLNADSTGRAPQGTAEGSEPRSGAATVRHTVEPGDTLWSIGAAHLPAGARVEALITRYWRQIYGANRNTLGPDPDLIHPGVTLSIPPHTPSAAAPQSPNAPRAAAPTWPRSATSTAKPAPDRLP